MSATETTTRDLAHWPANARAAYVLDDGTHTLELILTTDGHALLDGREFAVIEHVRVAEIRAGRAAARAGRI
jgi:hypothetical protein